MKRDQAQLCITSSIGPAVAFPPTLTRRIANDSCSPLPSMHPFIPMYAIQHKPGEPAVLPLFIFSVTLGHLPLDALTNWFRLSKHQLSPFLTATDGEVSHTFCFQHIGSRQRGKPTQYE